MSRSGRGHDWKVYRGSGRPAIDSAEDSQPEPAPDLLATCETLIETLGELEGIRHWLIEFAHDLSDGR